MKVLIIRNALSYDFGGAERLAVHLAEELNLNGIDAVVVSKQTKLLNYAVSKGVINLRGWWWSQQNWSGARALLFPIYVLWQVILVAWYLILLTQQRVDAIHIMGKDDFIAATFAGKLLGKQVVWTDPADLKHIFANHSKWYKNPVGKLVYIASRFADHVTLVSHSEEKLIEASLSGSVPENFQVLHIAGKDEHVKAAKRSLSDKNAVIFCSTSRLVEAKGISELIEGFKQIPNSDASYRLWLIGDGPDKPRFEKEAAPNKHIVFLGHLEKPLRTVAAADVFVHPTHHEGFSLSLTEAAMLGKPMIATNVGGNPELVSDTNGILVPVNSPKHLKTAMERLGADELLRGKLGRAARKDYVEKFDFSTIVSRRIIPLYARGGSLK